VSEDQLVVRVVNDLCSIDERAWDDLCSPEDFFKATYLRTLAQAGLDCTFRYFVAESENELVGFTLGFLTLFPIIGPLRIRTFISGTPVNVGLPFAFHPEFSKLVIFRELVRKILNEAESDGAKFIILRDFLDIDFLEEYDSVASNLGFRRTELFNDAILEIRWQSFEDYLKALRYGYRKDIRYDLRKVYRSGYRLEIFRGGEIMPYLTDLHRLWTQVYLRHPERDQLFLPLSYFRKIATLPECVVLLMFYKNKLAGFDLLIERGSLLEVSFCGQDYEITGKEPVDRALTHEIVRYAIQNKFRLVDFGISNEAIKARVGCALQRLYGYIRPLSGANVLRALAFERLVMRGYGFEVKAANMPEKPVFKG